MIFEESGRRIYRPSVELIVATPGMDLLEEKEDIWPNKFFDSNVFL
jgi:hypothetical protein